MSTPREHPEERLLELLLDGSGDAERELAGFRSDPAHAGRLADLERFLASCRGALAPERGAQPSARETALAERVLARTTREDLRWRGDLRLLTGFLGERLRSSRALRFAAASLALHLAALPVLAWYALRVESRDRLEIAFEAPATPLAEDFAEPPRELGRAAALDELDRAGWQSTSPVVDNNLSLARYWLLEGGVPETPAGVRPRPGVPALLAARSALLAGGDVDPAQLVSATGELAPLERVLFVELLLDRYARTGRVSPELDDALEALHTSGEASVAALAAHALERAAGYGWGGTEEPAELASPPITPDWLAALGRAVGERDGADPIVRAWLGWNPASR